MYLEGIVGRKEGNCCIDFSVIKYLCRDLVQSTGCSSGLDDYIANKLEIQRPLSDSKYLVWPRCSPL